MVLSGANRHDCKKLADLLGARVIKRPEAGRDEERAVAEAHLCLDRGYDYATCRETAIKHGYTAHIPKKASKDTPLPAVDDPDRHPPRRWVVEAAHSWFNRFRRVLVRWEKKAEHYLGFVQLAACLIIYRKLASAQLPG